MTRETLRRLSRAFALMARALDSEAMAMPRHQTSGVERRKLRLTPERRAQLKEQGEYIGSIRALPPRLKARVKREHAAHGAAAAIRLAAKLRRAA